MHIRSFTYPYWNNFIRNIESEKIGFYFSFSLHVVFLLFIIGFPNLFKSPPINVPTVIPIEILNIAERTSIPKEIIPKDIESTKNQEKIKEMPKQKKFNNLQTELIKNINTKTNSTKDTKEFEVNEKKKIEQNTKSLITTDEKQVLQEQRFESLPTKKIKPKIKPKPENVKITTPDTDIKAHVKSKPKSTFNIASMLKDLRNDQAEINTEKIKKNPTEEKIIKTNEETKLKAQLSISEIDLLIQQLSTCWIAPAGAKIENWMIIKVSAKINRNRRVLTDTVRIIDTNIPKSNSFYGPITESAMRTLLNPECNPLKLPEDKYEMWKDFKINFHLKLMRGN